MNMDDATFKQEMAQLLTPARCAGCGKAALDLQREIQRLRTLTEQRDAMRMSLQRSSWHDYAKAQLERQIDEMLNLSNSIAHENYLFRQALWARTAHLDAPVYIPVHSPQPPTPRRREP
ncbi:hypothetical protein GCK32_015302 [Trichostrongylus colubriformis]|uniref:Uncharacterized protein n=1 Tax=Trichostrongylus colubriformis TaxID=6319 RepID=A0AAN8ITC2_TRICO